MLIIGQKLTHSFEVSQEVYEGFVGTFKDLHPLHTNDCYAIARGFADKVMHGNILNGFLSYFVGECLPDREVMILSQSIRFSKPVYLQDTIVLEAVVADVHDFVGVIELAIKFRNGATKAVVASATMNIGRTQVLDGEQS